MRTPLTHLFCIMALYCLSTAVSVSHAEEVCGPMTPAEEQTLKLQSEHAALTAKVQELEVRRCISEAKIVQKKVILLKEIAADVKQQRQSMEDFQGFVSWMSQNLAGYNKYVKAGSYAAVVGKMLPIPYAGQAAVFTKFAAQFTIALNNASVAINAYLQTSQKYLTMTDALDPLTSSDSKIISEVAKYADSPLLKDMNDTQTKLAMVSELSAGALSFFESLSHYLSSTDEYWNKAKGLFRKDVDPKEKSYISESSAALKHKAEVFNARLTTFADLTKKQNNRIKALSLFDELLAELPQK